MTQEIPAVDLQFPAPTQPSMRDGRTPPVAIIGISSLFPGSLNTREFWRDILEGRDQLTDVPRTHWMSEDYFHPRPGTPDKVCSTRGGFLPAVDFSPLEFGLPPNIAQSTDSAQLLALIVAKRALLEATRGQLEKMDRSRISVVLGVASATELVAHMSGRLQIPVVQRAMRSAGMDEAEVARVSEVLTRCYVPWQESTFPGLLGNVVAGRIANRLDLGGTNAVVDAACGSSLAAVDMAINELALGRSDLVVTGGVDALNDILMFMCFAQTGAMSPTGDCRPFSENADGTMLGEGLGILALKRLADAERDGDAIYAVIRGLGTSSDGRAKSIYAPDPEGQALALRRAYARAGYGPETVELVEAHGTATKAGDVAEVQALKAVFGEAGARQNGCALGSVKAQIGHTKAAAGSAGLIKIVMALHHKVLPMTSKVSRPNPNLALENSPLYINGETRPWISPAHRPRRASVSALGFGGTNFHVAVEEYRGPAPRPPRFRTLPVELVLLSGPDAATVASRCRQLAEAIGATSLAHLARKGELEFDATAPARLAIVASNENELCEKLSQAAEMLGKSSGASFSTPRGIHFGTGPAIGPVAFLFPGQGSQYVGMGRDLAVHFNCAREAWDRCAEVDTGVVERIPDLVFPPPVWDEQARMGLEARLTATEWAQPAIAATSLALLEILERLELRPAFAGGHSLGEVTALGAFGALDRSATVKVARRRGELLAQAAANRQGAMIAVTAGLKTVKGLVDAWGLEVVLANHNAPNQVVLSGPVQTIEEAERRLQLERIEAKRLPVSTAFHSPLVQGACAPLREFLEPIPSGTPRVPLFSNRTGQLHRLASQTETDGSKVQDEVARAVAEPVLFVEQLEAMYAAGARVFVEVGPGSVLTRLVGRCLGERPHLAVELDARGKHGVQALLEGLARLSVAGIPLDLAALREDEAPVEDPASTPKSKLTLRLCGVNYQKPVLPDAVPQPAKTGMTAPASTLEVQRVTPHVAPAPAPTQSSPASSPSSRSALPSAPAVASPAPVSTALSCAPSSAAAIVPPTPVSSVAPAPAAFVAQATLPSAHPAHAPYATPAPSSALSAPPSALATLITAQMEYERLMAESHTAFLQAMAATSLGVSQPMIGSTVLAGQTPSALPSQALLEPSPMLAARLEAPGLMAPPPAPQHSAPIAAPEPLAPPEPASSPAPGPDLVGLMLSVVAEKTGYPAEMIELTMDLESDLGIDSIKRVEILSAVRTRAPGLPELDTARMSRMRTLQEILAFLGGPSAAGSLPNRPVSPEIRPTSASRGEGSSQPAPERDLVGLMLSVVAEKTGYPAEMIELTMDLESDLGIDSIKRVEILSAVRTRAPGLPELDTARMSRMRTLQEILAFLGGPSAAGSRPDIPASPETRPTSASRSEGSSQPAPERDLVGLMLSVVAEKTGYPAEMIELTMDLESDLGIDSIKRVEILSAVRTRAPGLPELDTARMSRMRTLQEILAFLSGASPATARSAESTSGQGPVTSAQERMGDSTDQSDVEVRPVGRQVARAVAAPAAGLAIPGLLTGSEVVLTPDGNGIAEALAARLRGRGARVKVADQPSEKTSAFIYLGGLRNIDAIADAIDVNQQAFSAVRSVAARFGLQGGTLVMVQDTGGAFGLEGKLQERAWLAGLAGLARTASEEWPLACVRTIDLEKGGRESDAIAAELEKELLFGGPELEVGLRADGTRLTLIDVAAPELEPSRSIPRGAVFVATGGARGVTAECLIALARQAHPRFVLLGRTELVEEPAAFRGIRDDAGLKRAALEEARASGVQATPKDIDRRVSAVVANRQIGETLRLLQQAGAGARYAAVDVRDAAAVGAVLEEVRRSWGPIQGVIHGAGVLSDALIEQKTDARFAAVWNTKVFGLQALLDATRKDPLEWICLFSSVAARAGNVGQADYAMANEVLNKVAAAEALRRGDACRVVSIGWGPWDGGMVTPALRDHFTARGVKLLGLASGAAAFVRELTGQGPVEVSIVGSTEATLQRRPRRIEAQVLVNKRTWPQLESHCIKGSVVLPMAIALEWFARLLRPLYRNAQSVHFRDLRVVRGVPLPGYHTDAGDLFQLIALPTEDGRSAALELRDDRGTLRYSASLDRDAVPAPTNGEAEVTLEPAPWKDSELYGPATLFHGSRFHILRSVDGISRTHARATLSSPPDNDWSGTWHCEPAILDGALQLAILFGLHGGGGPSLPMRIEQVTYHPTHLRDKFRCQLTSQHRTQEGLRCDLTITDTAGARVLDLVGVEMFVVPSGSTAN